MNPITLKRRRKPLIAKETLHTETKKAVKSLIITLGLMIAVLGIAFLFTTSQSAQKGYVFQQEKLKNEYLKSQNTALNTKITQATAYGKIENSDKAEEMQEIQEKNYVTSEDNQVY